MIFEFFLSLDLIQYVSVVVAKVSILVSVPVLQVWMVVSVSVFVRMPVICVAFFGDNVTVSNVKNRRECILMLI